MSVRFQAIFFDAGYTLLFPRVQDLARDLTAQGCPATVEDFYAAERAGKKKLDAWLWPQLRAGRLPKSADPFFWAEYLRALMDQVAAPEDARGRLMLRVAEGFRDMGLWSEVAPGTEALLASLRAQRYRLGVISNSSGMVEEQLRRAGLAAYFETILDSAVVGVEKPHAAIFHLALDRLGVRPEEALFVGDVHSTDVGGAHGAGMAGVLMDRDGAYTGRDGELGCPKISALAELETALAEWKLRWNR